MLLRHILGYAPSNVAPALTALAIIVVFTRVMPPVEFGRYGVAQAAVLMVQALAFYGLQMGITRFYATRHEAGDLPRFISSAYACFAALAGMAGLAWAGAVLALVPDAELAATLWAALPLLILRGLVTVNLAIHRGALAVRRHNLTECTQSLAGILLATLLVTVGDLGAVGIVAGLAAGSLLAALLDLDLIVRNLRRPAADMLRELAGFGAPLVLSFAFTAVTAYADRVFLERLAGADAVAIYAVAFGLVDRPVTLVFMAVSLAAFPLAVDQMQRQGTSAAREQLLRNGAALLALAVPAVTGLACVAEPLTAILVGEGYRAGVATLLPWMAALALMQGINAHYVAQAIHLANRTELFVWTIGPAAAASLALNPVLIPRLGSAGALAAAFVAQVVALALTAVVARRVFPIGFPSGQAARITLATGCMAAALHAVPVPSTPLGLIMGVGLGAAVYGVAAALLDVVGIGRMLLRMAAVGRAAPGHAPAQAHDTPVEPRPAILPRLTRNIG
jgi:O-antigen/teichoic acid export membrane protein